LVPAQRISLADERRPEPTWYLHRGSVWLMRGDLNLLDTCTEDQSG